MQTLPDRRSPIPNVMRDNMLREGLVLEQALSAARWRGDLIAVSRVQKLYDDFIRRCNALGV